jgi:hypothetical protein
MAGFWGMAELDIVKKGRRWVSKEKGGLCE